MATVNTIIFRIRRIYTTIYILTHPVNKIVYQYEISITEIEHKGEIDCIK